MSYANFQFEVDGDGIALITFDMPDRSMNVLAAPVVVDLVAIAERISTDAAIKGAVLTSGKSAFCAGADLSELGGALFDEPASDVLALKRRIYDFGMRLQTTFRKLETCGKPVVAAINGLALGGGLELTLACHRRIAADDNPKLKLGLPEAMVGVLPGGGGTQRLPRMIGAMGAFDLMLQGKQIDAQKALALGVVDELAPTAELVARAKAWVAEPEIIQPDGPRAGEFGLKPGKSGPVNAKAVAPWDKPKFKIPGGGPYHPAGAQVFGGAPAMVRKNTAGNYPAQRLILSCVYEGLQTDIDGGLRIESRYFADLLVRPESQNMIRSIFLSKQDLDKGGRRPAGQEAQAVKKIAVIGAGFMGAGIANVSAQAGIDVVLVDVDQESAERGKGHAEKDLAKRVSRGRMTQERADAILARIHPSANYADFADADLVVEAVFENADLKNKITKEAEAQIRPDAVMASNTSTIPITGLSSASVRPDNYIGIHFFSPVEKMMLVEIITGDNTGDYATSRAIDFVTAIKKTPIVVKDTRGFYANRCVLRFVEQGTAMLAEGYNPALIENGARMAGMPMGPMELSDMTAIDLGYKIMTQTKSDLGDAYVPSPGDPIITKMYELGRYGRKTQKGFYDYSEDGKSKKLWPELAQFAVNGVLPEDQQPDVQLVKDRILFAQALEAARTMEEGIVQDPREADVGSILAWGFAPYTGGVLSFIDSYGQKSILDGPGVGRFLARAEELSAQFPGHIFAIPAIIRDLAAKNETFYQRFGQDAPQPVAAE